MIHDRLAIYAIVRECLLFVTLHDSTYLVIDAPVIVFVVLK